MSVAKAIYEQRNKLFGHVLGRRVAFHHVPKCAGTSVSRALRRRYALSQHSVGAPLTIRTVGRIFEMPENPTVFSQNLREFRLGLFDYFLEKDYYFVGGHVPFNRRTFDAFGAGRSFVTVLRDPSERLLSEYFHLQRQSSTRRWEDIESFLKDPLAPQFANRYCEYFFGESRYLGATEPNVVSKAIENLKLFSVIGFTDNMTQFGTDLKSALGASIQIGRENTKNSDGVNNSNELSDSLRHKIDSLCAADREVFLEIRQAKASVHVGSL